MNKKIQMLVFCLVMSKYIPVLGIRSAITTEQQVGRIGNCLWNYCFAEWVAKKTNLPCHFRQLENNQEKRFAYSRLEPALRVEDFRTTIELRGKDYMQIIEQHKNRNTLFIVPFLFREPGWSSNDQAIKIFKQDKDFIEELRSKIKPVRPIVKIEKPANMLSVALHIRKGGGYYADKDDVYIKFPTKFPPDSFYIEQLVKLSFMLEHAPLFVFIFTDDPNPQDLVQRFDETIHLPNITFAYRETGNGHNKNVLDDLFNITTFDYLIRPDSSFTRVAEILGKHKIVIYPKNAHVDPERRLFFISEVGVNIYDRSLKKFIGIPKN